MFFQNHRAFSPDACFREFRKFTRKLIRAQPAMSSVNHVATLLRNAAQNAIRKGYPQRLFFLCLKSHMAKTDRDLRRALPRLAGVGQGLIQTGQTILTHSASDSVFHVLRAAHLRGKHFTVLAARSFPGGEGASFAARLRTAGVRCRAVSDAHALKEAAKTDLFLVGADRVTPRHFINKVKTRRLAAAARRAGRPVYAVLDHSKMDFRGGSYDKKIFEKTPNRLVTVFLTDRGKFSSAELRNHIPAFR